MTNTDKQWKIVLPLVSYKIKEYSNGKPLKFIPTTTKKVPKTIVIIVMLWLLIMCGVSISIIKEPIFRMLSTCFFAFFIVLVPLLVNKTETVVSIDYFNGDINIITRKREKIKNRCYSIQDIQIESRLSKNNDAFTSIFYLYVTSDGKTKTYRIDAGNQYNDFIAFMTTLLIIKENPASPTLPETQKLDLYLKKILF